MSRSPESPGRHRRPSSRSPKWLPPLTAAVLAAAGAWLCLPPTDDPVAGQEAPSAGTSADRPGPTLGTTTAPGDTAPDTLARQAVTTLLATASGSPLPATSQGVVQQLGQLVNLPPGDASIALGQLLTTSATPETAPAFRSALLKTTDPAVERVAIAALARTADSGVMLALADDYGRLPPEQRGRVLQVLEGAANPAALDGLAQIVAADTSEKRSPLVMSALYGAAGLGTMESVDYLLRQTTTDSADLALIAMERVRTRQGVELIRAAAAGSKGHEQLSPSLRSNLARIARTAESQITP